jgi:hypothetical protein
MSVSLVAVQETRLPVGAIYSIAIRDCNGCETHFFTSLNGNRHEITFRQLTGGGGFRALEQLRSSGSIHAFGLGDLQRILSQKESDAMRYAQVPWTHRPCTSVSMRPAILPARWPRLPRGNRRVVWDGPLRLLRWLKGSRQIIIERLDSDLQ